MVRHEMHRLFWVFYHNRTCIARPGLFFPCDYLYLNLSYVIPESVRASYLYWNERPAVPG